MTEVKKETKIDTLKEIELILSSYFLKGSSMQINELLDLRDKLAIHSYRLAEYTAGTKTTYNASYFNRKISVLKETQNIINARKLSKAQATVDAELANEELFEMEQIDEANAYKHDLLLKQVNQVLSAMQQRISYLKKEKDE